MSDIGYEEHPSRQAVLSENQIDPSSSLEWRVSHGLAEREHITQKTRDWQLLTQTLWERVQEGDSQISNLLEDALDNPVGPDGLRMFLEQAEEVFQGIAKLSRKRGLTRIGGQLLRMLDELPEGVGKGKLPDIEESIQPDVYMLNNASKDILLMSLGANLMKHGLDKDGFVRSSSGCRVRIDFFDDVPLELQNPKQWNFRFNLKDRAWIVSAGNRKFLLREQKSPQHFDHMVDRDSEKTIPLDEYSKPSVDEAQLSSDFERSCGQYTGVHLVAERPIVAIQFPKTTKGESYQLGIYEFEEGMITDRSLMLESLGKSFESSETVRVEYSHMLSKMTLFNRQDILSFREYCVVRADVLLNSIPFMIRRSFAKQGLQNGDKDGFGLRLSPEGVMDVVIFDFERVTSLEDDDPFIQVIRNDEAYVRAIRRLISQYSLYNSPMDLMGVQGRFTPSIQQLQRGELGEISMFANDMSGRFIELGALGMFSQMGGLGDISMVPKTRVIGFYPPRS